MNINNSYKNRDFVSPRFIYQSWLKYEMTTVLVKEEFGDDADRTESNDSSPTGPKPREMPLRTRKATSTPDSRLFEEDRSPTSVRQLSRIRRFLSTLLHLGTDLSPSAGDKVRSYVLNLVSGVITIDEFHQAIREVTGSQLRPFVLPFLKANLPLLQREIAFFARLAKQTPQQYLRGHESLALDPSYTPSDIADYFSTIPKVESTSGKRKFDSFDSSGSDECITPKRPHVIINGTPNSCHRIRDYTERCSSGQSQAPSITQNGCNSSNGEPLLDDEWSNIHTMLGCIQTMVEKTRRALAILQQRTLESPRLSPQPTKEMHNYINEILLQSVRSAEERIADIKRKAGRSFRNKALSYLRLNKKKTTKKRFFDIK
ncbi:protein CBFA2T3-like isoform X3 [Artemia franciscana]|uniref:protein CBFA2T3-like isoform X3 n=2 Tax=Artemia franciscana TaxID=6661 RepID=UPI0032DB1485